MEKPPELVEINEGRRSFEELGLSISLYRVADRRKRKLGVEGGGKWESKGRPE